MKHPSVKRVILFSLLALVLGAVQPALVALSMAVCVAPVLICLLFAWAGWIPAAIMSLTSVLSIAFAAPISYGVNGAAAGLAAAVVFVLPAAVGIWALDRRKPFFRRTAVQISIQTAALLAFMAVIYLGFRLDLVDLITAWILETVAYMPTELMSAMFSQFAMSGMLTQESIEAITSGIVTHADVMEAFEQALDTMNYQMKLTLPAMLLNSGLLTGLLSVWLPSAVCARRGDEPQVEHRPIHTWSLPSKAVAGVLLCSATGIALQLLEASGAEGATIVFNTLGSTLFMLQGVAALSRRFRARGMRPVPRRLLIAAIFILASNLLSIIGAASALFGRKGAVTEWIRKRAEERKEDDDE